MHLKGVLVKKMRVLIKICFLNNVMYLFTYLELYALLGMNRLKKVRFNEKFTVQN